jgi:hypothetical protein
MEVGIEVEGPQVWLLGNDLTHDHDAAGAPVAARPDAARTGLEPTRCPGVTLEPWARGSAELSAVFTSDPNHGSRGCLRLPSESDSGLNVVVVTEFSSKGAAS